MNDFLRRIFTSSTSSISRSGFLVLPEANIFFKEKLFFCVFFLFTRLYILYWSIPRSLSCFLFLWLILTTSNTFKQISHESLLTLLHIYSLIYHYKISYLRYCYLAFYIFSCLFCTSQGNFRALSMGVLLENLLALKGLIDLYILVFLILLGYYRGNIMNPLFKFYIF